MRDSGGKGEDERIVISFDDDIEAGSVSGPPVDGEIQATHESGTVSSEEPEAPSAAPWAVRHNLGKTTQVAMAGIVVFTAFFLISVLTVVTVSPFTSLLPDGKPGPAGKIGMIGDPGAKGKRGERGRDARDGKPGNDGFPGFNGQSVQICTFGPQDAFWNWVDDC
jgi:hypothetical protein